MSKVKNEGLEVVRMQPMAVADHNGDLRWMTAHFVADCELYAMPDFGRAPDLCRRSEAIAGYAERDAWIAAQDVQIKVLQSNANSWQSGYDEGRRMGAKHCTGTIDQLRAELAALNARLDASKFCANVADVQQVSVPDCFESYRLADKFCEQRLVTDDHVRAIVVDAFASGYGFGIAAAPVAKQDYGPLTCDYCGAETRDPWHGSGSINGTESKHIHACDNCRDLLPVAKQVVMPDADHSAHILTMVVPDGYKLVPIEPTPKMVDATWDHPVDAYGGVESQNARNIRVYKAMLAASPPAKDASQ